MLDGCYEAPAFEIHSSHTFQALLRGCRCVEIDVWDGDIDSDSESSSDSSSDSETEDEKSTVRKLKDKAKGSTSTRQKSPKGDKETIKSKLSSKLDGVLRRKSVRSPPRQVDEEAATSHMPIQREPRVLHGHTLTKGTTFREICYAIRESAFIASDLPLVISLEVHASLEQQQTMVDIMVETWKEFLVEAPKDEEKLPSLADMKRKILIKSKGIPLCGDDRPEEGATLTPQNSVETTSSQQQAKPSKILEALARMAVYTRAYSFRHFEQPGRHEASS